ncbi:MAG: uncharacterized protein JWR07_1814 [Nevskia sp.]|nr:uncharacterized protein [Nevskia sp.]
MKIGLALSGGGTRAAIFHLGVLRRLALDGRLEQIACVSSVSGGSIAIALVMSHAGVKWPTSQEYLTSVYPELRNLLSSRDLFSVGAIAASPLHWHRVFTNRARIVADFLEKRWQVKGDLIELPDSPRWLINTTCIETGKNWRFSKMEMGDWVFGKHYQPPFSVAEAAAASAAVPYVIGSLAFKLPVEGWYETNPGTKEPLGRKALPFRKVNLWDGGAYENLGLEPLYKIEQGMINCDCVLVSDASGGLPPVGGSSLIKLLRGQLSSPRLFDISSDQIRFLRSRMFVSALTRGEAKGAFIRMGNSVRDIDIACNRLQAPSHYAAFQSDADAQFALKHPTTLSAVTAHEFERIARNGFEIANATINAYCKELNLSKQIWEAH